MTSSMKPLPHHRRVPSAAQHETPFAAIVTGLAVMLAAVAGVCEQQAGEFVVFADPLEPETIALWEANSCIVEAATDIVYQGAVSLKLTDQGANAQAFLKLTTTPGLRYRVRVYGYRHSSNTGDWLGCAAVSVQGGRGPSSTYVARSDFIEAADEWRELSLEFEAQTRSAYLILTGQNGLGDVTRFDNLQVTCVGAPGLTPLLEEDPKMPPEVEGMELTGSPRQIGELWGTLNASAIHNDLDEYYLTPAAKAGLSVEELIRRSKKFVSLARDLAPHWIQEAEAVAEAADVAPDLYLSFVASVYRSLWQGEECTSFAVSPEYTEENRIFFHKNRDNVPKHQCAFVMATDLPGINKFISVSDASVIACMMMVNEKGLAGSADVGGLREDNPRYRGWMNTALLRYIAEKASDCQEALAIIEEFVRDGNYAGGTHGTHWLFVDRHGTILEVSNNATRVEHQYHDQKVYFSVDRGAAVRRMQQLPEPIDFASFRNVSRDESTCFPQSISGMSVEIHRDYPDFLTVAWISMPARSLGFPLFMGGVKTPQVLLNGDVDIAGRGSSGDYRQWEPIEAFAFDSQRRLEAHVETLLEQGKTAEARTALDDWAAAACHAHLAVLSVEDVMPD